MSEVVDWLLLPLINLGEKTTYLTNRKNKEIDTRTVNDFNFDTMEQLEQHHEICFNIQKYSCFHWALDRERLNMNDENSFSRK